MSRQNTYMIVIVVVAAIALFGVPRLLQGGNGPSSPPNLPSTVLAPMVSFIESRYQKPQDYIVSTFKNHDIVFVGEFYKIAQNVNLIRDVIPALYAAGVRNLGIEYALYADQARIDALLTAPAWNEAEARAVTFDWVVTWGYREYIELFHAAWQLNSALPKGSTPFRIVGLSVKQNWQNVKTQKDLENPETVRQILAAGIPDQFTAQTIMKEFVDKREKALVYCGQMHALTAYKDEEYAKNAATQGLSETRRAGNIVYDAIKGRAFTILLHSPWFDTRSRTGLAYPAGGYIDALIQALPEDKRSAGFDTADTPMGNLKVAELPFASGHGDLTLSKLCNGYVIQGPISGLTTVTVINDFITEANAAEAAKNFPGSKPDKMDAASLNAIIAQDVTQVDAMLRQFK